MVLNRPLFLAVLAIGPLHTATASVILVSPTPFSGTGLGAVNTILTMTSPGSTTTESGCVGFGSSGDVIGSAACVTGNTGGNELTGASQTLTRTVAQSGATSASNFRIVFNAVEPGGNSITLDSLAVRFFSPTGTVLYTASTAAPITFPSTFTGMGNSGFVFSLDAAQAAAATAAGAFGSAANRIGLSASASNATGGPETFFVTSSAVTGGGGGGSRGAGSAVPEPATYVLLGAGLVAFGLKSRISTS
jgi:hypothetical protein